MQSSPGPPAVRVGVVVEVVVMEADGVCAGEGVEMRWDPCSAIAGGLSKPWGAPGYPTTPKHSPPPPLYTSIE